MNGYYKQLIKILKNYNIHFIRNGKGDHEIWGNGTTSQPVDRNCRSRFTANAILKNFGIKEKI